MASNHTAKEPHHGYCQSYSFSLARGTTLLARDWRVHPDKFWKASGSNREKAGYLQKSGYVVIRVEGALHKAHRLAWLYLRGRWPKHGVDHKDGNKSNNIWPNLREATSSQNNQNLLRAHASSSSSLLGVSWSGREKKWRAQIKVDGLSRSLGYYASAEEASAAYLSAKRKLHSFNTL